jgi:hypothetical protein
MLLKEKVFKWGMAETTRSDDMASTLQKKIVD